MSVAATFRRQNRYGISDPISHIDRGIYGTETNHKAPLRRTHPKKTIVICNHGFIYNVRVPHDEIYLQTVSLSQAEHDRILAKAKGPSLFDKELETIKKAVMKKKADMKAAEERKRQIIEKDLFAIKHEEEQEEKAGRLAFNRMREKAVLKQDNSMKKIDRWILNSKIQAERDKQLVWKKRCEEIEISKKKAEFDRVLRCTQEAMRKDEEKEKKRARDAFEHLESIKKQVRDREQAALKKRNEKLYEFNIMKDKIEEKIQWLEECKEERLQELKACGIPEKYCRYVRRKTKEDSAHPNQYLYRSIDTLDQLPRWTFNTFRNYKQQKELLNPLPPLPPIALKDASAGYDRN